MTTLIFSAAAVAIALGSLGCAAEPGDSGDTSFPGEPFATMHGGDMTIEVRTAPEQPPVRGESSVELTLSDAAGEPVDGLVLRAVPWMPAMGHGASVQPVLRDEGDGRYRFDDVDMFMPGEWELRLTVAGKTSDFATPRFQIH